MENFDFLILMKIFNIFFQPGKAVSSEEKFNRLKELYNKLKDEHVSLLRQVKFEFVFRLKFN